MEGVDESAHAGRVALVTGGGRGIGAATARLLASQGAAVALAARTGDEVASVAEEIEARGGAALPLVVDVTDEASIASGFQRVRSELGPVTILVNNAGTPGVPLPVAALQPDSWRHAFEVNVTGAFLCAREALPQMAAENWGRIVNVSSAAARHPAAGMAAYSASKGGIGQLTKSLAAAWAPRIRVNAVAPGWIATPLTQTLQDDPERSRPILSRTPMGRWGEPEEVAGGVVFMASPAARFVTGAILAVDGGYLTM